MSAGHHLIIAVAPLAIGAVVAVAAVIGGVFAIFRKKKTGELPPGVDDSGKAASPFLNMASGTSTAMLEYSGGLYRWSIAGAVPTNGSDADAGNAAIAMAEALTASEEGASVTGSAGGPNSPTIEFGVEPGSDDDWEWSVTAKSKLPAATPGVPVPPIMLKTGFAPSRSIGIIAALAEVSDRMDWLDVKPPMDGGAVEGVGAPKEIHGIVVSSDQMTVAITDLPQWIAFAAPHARELLDAGKTADEIMDETIADLPDGAKLNGIPIEDVRKSVTELLDMVRSDDYVVVASPDEELAAFVVGAKLRPSEWWVAEYKGHVILVRPIAVGGGGGFQAQGASGRWEYLIWNGGSRGYDDAAVERVTMGAGKNRNNTIRYAKQRIDQGMPASGDGDAGGNQSATAAADWSVPTAKGQFQAPPSIDSKGYTPDVVKISLSAMWSKPKTTDVEIFDFKDGDFAKFKHWRIVVGMCLTLKDDPKYPFGSLSITLDQYGACDDACKIRNSDVTDGAIGPPPPIDWESFVKPLVWKGQFDGAVHRGAVIGITQPSDITGSGGGAEVDPCADREAHWPTPSNSESGFLVQIVGHVDFTQWHPAPEVSFVTKGTKVYARVRYAGLPVFAKGGGGVSQAQAGIFTNYELAVQIWAAGTNKE